MSNSLVEFIEELIVEVTEELPDGWETALDYLERVQEHAFLLKDGENL